MTWSAANARARGLATHLLDRSALVHAAGAGSWAATLTRLEERGYTLPDPAAHVSPEEFDRATVERDLLLVDLHADGGEVGVGEDARDVAPHETGLADRERAEHADLLLDHRVPAARAVGDFFSRRA